MIISEYLKPIWSQGNQEGNGIIIGDKLFTAAHVLLNSEYFHIGTQKYNVGDALINQHNDRRTEDGLFFDIAVFASQEYSPLELATDLPLIGEELISYSYKHCVTKEEKKGLFDTVRETEELHVSKAIVREIIGNFIICEMNEPLEEGRSGSPIIKDGKVYGILHGGVEGSPCVFLSSVVINQILSH